MFSCTRLSLVKMSKDVFEGTIAFDSIHISNLYEIYSEDDIIILVNDMFYELGTQTRQVEHVRLTWTFLLSKVLAKNIFCTSLTLQKFEISCGLEAKTAKVLGWGLQFATGLTKLKIILTDEECALGACLLQYVSRGTTQLSLDVQSFEKSECISGADDFGILFYGLRKHLEAQKFKVVENKEAWENQETWWKSLQKQNLL